LFQDLNTPILALMTQHDSGPGGDPEALRALAERLAARRLERNQTQAQLARSAGVSLRTLVRLERGESTQLTNLVRVLRALDLLAPLLESLAALTPPPQSRPLAQLRSRARTRRRASPRRPEPSHPTHATAVAEPAPWVWGDERAGRAPGAGGDALP
jgi:transcriptional regulator with XRE-family HTH domain